MATEQIRSIELSANSNREFFLIHGYTGSPTDFQQLPHLLNKKFNANVRVLLLPGHGTRVQDLDAVTYENLFGEIALELEKDIQRGREIVVGGISLGGLFSLILASKYPIKGVFNISSPYLLKFPLNLPFLGILGRFKKYWKKPNVSILEKELREGSFSYRYMHSNGLSFVKQAAKDLEKNLAKINVPTLSIYSTADKIVHRNSHKKIQDSLKTSVKKEVIFSLKPHSVFFSAQNAEIYREIFDFVENNNVFHDLVKSPKKIAAIVPSYDEGERIGDVLKALNAVPDINDIIVVDDGSKDNTEAVVKKFKDVKYLRNERNIGKAGSMERGVESTDADIIFFCDADLIGLTPEIVKNIISPVVEGKYSMFIGIRGNIMQKSVHLFAINSGERALRREVWEQLPSYFKYKYRVEAGLNYWVKKYFNGFGYKTFDYSQPIKEKKYGFIRGTILRWGMNLDVLWAYFRATIGGRD